MLREATIEIAGVRGGPFLVRLLKSPVPYPDMLDYSPLDLDPASLPGLNDSQSVATYGQKLRSALALHTAVGSELQQLLLVRAPGTASLVFAITAPDAEAFRWETLCENPPGFWALTGTCNLKRVVKGANLQSFALRMFSPPLRLAAFLSPAGVSAKGEFEAIVGAIQVARGKGLDIEGIFYLGEQALIDEATESVQRRHYEGITVKALPSDAIALEKTVIQEKPQIVHFFCHGNVSAGEQLLEFASINDHDIAAVTGTARPGSVPLSLQRLCKSLASGGTAWITVLNSCSGAQSAPRLYSMASMLADTAIPAAIGMAEPILDRDATLFAQGFYEHVLEDIRNAIDGMKDGDVSTIDVGPAVTHARSRLHAALTVNDSFARWSLPILYQREGGLQVARLSEEVRKRIEAVSQALRSLPSETPPDLRDGILALLDKEPVAPKRLRPDRFGNLT